MHEFPCFHPWIGEQYATDNCFGVRVLVVGESHYWDGLKRIQYADLWTNTVRFTQGVVVEWGLNPQDNNGFFTNVSSILQAGVQGDQHEYENGALWNHVMFYNYVQSFVAWPEGQDRPDRPTKEQWQEGIGAFDAILQILHPNVVLMLGGPNDGTSGWIAHNHNHDKFRELYCPYEHNGIHFLGIYHPGAIGYWYRNLYQAMDSFSTLLEETRMEIGTG